MAGNKKGEDAMAFLEHLNHLFETKVVEGSFPVQFRYTTGVAGETFFKKLKEEGKIFGTRCNTCQYTYLPPRLFCERCFSELEEWVDVGLDGELYSYALVYRDLNGDSLEHPQIVGLIKFLHADSLFFHYILADPSYLRIGMKVQAIIKPARQRKGHISDIKGFVPRP